MSNRAAGLRPEKISKQVLKFKVDCLSYHLLLSNWLFRSFSSTKQKKSMVDKGYGKAGKSWEVRSFWLLLEFHGSWVEIMRNSEKCLEMPNCLYYTVKPMYRKSVEKERRVWKSWEFYRAWIKPSEYESNFANSESVTYPSWAVGWALSFAPNLCNEKCYKGKSKWDSIYITNMIITFKAFQRRLWRTNFKALDPVKSKQR